MVRRWFYFVSAGTLFLVAVMGMLWPPALAALAVVGPLVGLGIYDVVQRRRTILRNFPILGHFRYGFEAIRPEIQQYFVESNIDAFPIEREMRSIVYRRAKGQLETQPFGTQRDVYRDGYEWAAHSLTDVAVLEEEPRIRVGGRECRHPYLASRLNISAMSFGALSPTAVRALALGAKKGGFSLNTGEGGISPHHREGGADLVWQIGTGYFGCRNADGTFDSGRFRAEAAADQVRMIELKLSQGAKPGHGGILPAPKVTPEIAAIRGLRPFETVFSPPRHSAFAGPVGLLEFVARLRELSGGKPVGFKLSVGRRREVLSVCKAMRDTGIAPDFVTVDGGEGGTGAAPLEFANSVGMPARDAWILVHNALRGAGLRDQVRLFASGKIFTGFHMIRAMALGADACNSARGMMLALGCIQALRCNNDTCPTGIATQNGALYRTLDVPDKSERVFRFHRETVHSFLELLAAMGLEGPEEISGSYLFRRISPETVKSFEELYEVLADGALLNGSCPHEGWRADWEAA
ncbi:MAG: FMN-binding glutamate synthase family protein [Gemmatimonadota bacterium]